MSGVSRSASQPHVGILGGGITGLTAAFYLLLTGYRVTVVEARPHWEVWRRISILAPSLGTSFITAF